MVGFRSQKVVIMAVATIGKMGQLPSPIVIAFHQIVIAFEIIKQGRITVFNYGRITKQC